MGIQNQGLPGFECPYSTTGLLSLHFHAPKGDKNPVIWERLPYAKQQVDGQLVETLILQAAGTDDLSVEFVGF